MTPVVTFSPAPKPAKKHKRSPKAIERRERLKLEKRDRSERSFARKYGSLERVTFVNAMRCAACRAAGRSENAHVLGNDGIGRKKGFESIAPLCRACHELYDEHRDVFDDKFPTFDAVAAAAKTQRDWLAHVALGSRFKE